MKFDEFGINKDLLSAISYMGFEKTTPIQEQAIPEILAGKDLIACAQTGTGKTAAFLIPILDNLANHPRGETTTLIIVPTRELAIQID
ncbi:MAG: DEAD/DEAH box helicase, partial [Bacteroidales bacterium]|nr:DEAD/DEAH box helicase [Bacteroidales bacterium]